MKRERAQTVTISLRVPWDLLKEFDGMWRRRKIKDRTVMILRVFREEVERHYAAQRAANDASGKDKDKEAS
jgi:metal-responsive CopG/Arc/MetJ family transcriptional regulator